MKARDLETRIKNLESAIMDMQKLLQVINERISHNGRGIDLLIDLDSDTDNDTVSEDIKPLTLEDYLDTIRNADDNEGKDYVELYYIIRSIGENLINWGLEFEDTKRQIVRAIRRSGSDWRNLPGWVDRSLLMGVNDAHQNS